MFRRSQAPVRIGGSFLGVSTRSDGKVRANFLNDPATGQDRAAVKAVRRAAGQAVECPVCGGSGNLGRTTAAGSVCQDDWHRTCGRK
jgi:hypothetical protein